MKRDTLAPGKVSSGAGSVERKNPAADIATLTTISECQADLFRQLRETINECEAKVAVVSADASRGAAS